MKDNNLLLNIDIDFEFLVCSSKLHKAATVLGMKDFLEASFQEMKKDIHLFLVLLSCLRLGINLAKSFAIFQFINL